MTRRTPKVINPVDPHNADDRTLDRAFKILVHELTEARKWSELQAAFLLHGSTLTRREERWTTKTTE